MKQNKYFAKATVCREGHKHPSKREANHCDELHIIQACGQIANLEYEPFFPFVIAGVQLKHENGRRLGYKPDFVYTKGSQRVAEDVKSKATMTEAFALRAALFRHLYPDVQLRIIK